MPSCPAGHDSISADFCDICGLAMGGVSAAAPSPTPSAVSDANCPECGEARTGRFCEGCSYDFVAGAGHAPAVTIAEPVEAPAAVATMVGWAAVVSADRAHYDAVRLQDGPDAADIAFPAYCPERNFELTGQQ